MALLGSGLALVPATAAHAQRRKVALTVSTPTADLGQLVRFRGHARGAAGAAVELQQRGRKRWKRVSRTHVSRRSKFRFSVRFHKFGRLRLRAKVSGGG